MTLQVGSLFSGIGGIDLGLERTGGFRTAWFAEVDPYASAVLKRHWPDVPNLGDVRTIEGDVPRVDVLAGGFPCQPVSLAGKRLGEFDPRWLWPEFARLVGDLRPRVVLVENVPGLASKGLGDVLADLSSLGYDAEWDVVSAASVGAPHLRERLFLVGYPVRLDGGSWGPGRPDPASPGEPVAVWSLPDAGARDVAHPDSTGWSDSPGSPGQEAPGRAVFGSDHAQRGPYVWLPEPDVGRVAHGVPSRLDRLRCLGNGVVPQVAEFVGHLILEAVREGRI